jgi:hypothetical protein
MKKHICKLIRKDLSRARHFGGVLFDEYYENIFHAFYNSKFMISKNDLKNILLKDEFVKFDYSNKETIISLISSFYETKEHKENEEDVYNYNYIKNLFKEENNTLILIIYKLIIDFEKTTYNEISSTISKINSSLKIDKKQTSHYCKLLKKINFLYKGKKLSKNNERVVFKNETNNLYNKVEIEQSFSDEEDNSENEALNSGRNFKEQICFQFDTLKNLQANNSANPEKILDFTNEESLYITNSLKLNKHYLENRFSLIIDENNIENNLYFHLLINKEKGLTINQVCSLLGFLGRDKAIVRFLNNLDKKNYIQHFSIRKGKKFEYVYKINEAVAPVEGFIYKYVEYYKNKFGSHSGGPKIDDVSEKLKLDILVKQENNLALSAAKSRSNLNKSFSSTCTNSKSNQNFIISENDSKLQSTINSKNKKLNFSSNTKNDANEPSVLPQLTTLSHNKFIKQNTDDQDNLHSQIKLEHIKIEPVKFNFDNNITLNDSDFLFILNRLNDDERYQSVKEKYQESLLKYLNLEQEQNNLIISNTVENENLHLNKNFEKNSLAFQPQFFNPIISSLSNDSKLHIILEFFYANSKFLKLRTFDNVNLNRFLFCLNKIQERKILTMNDIKLFIINELENKIGFKIDRKTLRNVLLNLEALGFIKTMEFELVMKNKNYTYSNNKEEIVQRKLIVMRRDVNLTPEMIGEIEELIKPRQKVTPGTDLELLDLEFYENENHIKEMIKEDVIGKSGSKNLSVEGVQKISNLNMPAPFLNKLQTPIKDFREIKKEINNIVKTHDLSIDYCEKNILNLTQILEKIRTSHDDKNCNNFFLRWKRFYFIKQNLIQIFQESKEKKNLIKIENDENYIKVPLYKLLETHSNQKVIVPEFMMKNIIREPTYPYKYELTKIPDDRLSTNNPYSKYTPDIASLISSKDEEKRKYETPYDTTFFGEMNLKTQKITFNSDLKLNEKDISFAHNFLKVKPDFEENCELLNFIENKRNRSDENEKNYAALIVETRINKKIKKMPSPYELKKDIAFRNRNKKFSSNHYNKLIDFYPIINKIYFNPNITMKKLRHSLVTLLPSEMIYTDFLLYLNKIGVLKISNLNEMDYNSEKLKIDDDMCLELDESASKFLDI